MSRLVEFFGRFIGAYSPEEWGLRENRTNRAIIRSRFARQRAGVAANEVEQMLATSRIEETLAASYRAGDERMKRQ
jgi:hypothetical protein